MLRVLLLVLLVTASVTLQGCAVQHRDYRDARHDPRPGHSLLDQIPNWDDAATRRCGGHLHPNQRRPGMTDRC